MTEELTVEVPIVFTGVAPAVELNGGTLLHMTETVRVRALPDHLPQSLSLAIDSLVDYEVTLHVRDLVIPSDVTLLTDLDEAVVRVQAPRQEEVAPVVAEAEGEPAAEGAEAAEAGDPPRAAKAKLPAPAAGSGPDSSAGYGSRSIDSGRLARAWTTGTRQRKASAGGGPAGAPSRPAAGGARRVLEVGEQLALGVLLEEVEVGRRIVVVGQPRLRGRRPSGSRPGGAGRRWRSPRPGRPPAPPRPRRRASSSNGSSSSRASSKASSGAKRSSATAR